MDTAHRSGCPINLTLEMLGDRWSLIVIRDLMFGNRRHFRELLDPLGRGDRLQHPGRPAEAADRKRAVLAPRRSEPQAEGHLQPDRTVDPAGAAAGADGRLGQAAYAGVGGAVDPRRTGGGRADDVEGVHGGVAGPASGGARAGALGVCGIAGGVSGGGGAQIGALRSA